MTRAEPDAFPAAPPDVLRLRGPADVVAAIPYLLGFEPADSIVVLSLRGERGRVGLTMRVDLPPPELAAQAYADLAAHAERDRASRTVVACYGVEVPGGWSLLKAALDARGIGVLEALRVHGGRWWSYLCADPVCCPPQGTVIVAASDPGGPTRVAATMVGAGHVALPSREALAATIAPESGRARADMSAALDAAARRAAAHLVRPGGLTACRRAWERQVEQALQGAVHMSLDGPPPTYRRSDQEVAELLVAVADIPTRDAAAGWTGGRRGDAAIALWSELARRAPAPYDVAPATLLSLAAWRAGHGALARVAVERALTSDPSYRLALLVERVLDGGVNPALLARPQGRPARRRAR